MRVHSIGYVELTFLILAPVIGMAVARYGGNLFVIIVSFVKFVIYRNCI